MKVTEKTLQVLFECLISSPDKIKLNKASMISWMIFISSYQNKFDKHHPVAAIFENFEKIKRSVDLQDIEFLPKKTNRLLINKILSVYQDRSSSRVADISSVVLRDICLWSIVVIYFPFIKDETYNLSSLHDSIFHLTTVDPNLFTEQKIEDIANNLDWGSSI